MVCDQIRQVFQSTPIPTLESQQSDLEVYTFLVLEPAEFFQESLTRRSGGQDVDQPN